jgi:hypothetical protein
MNFDDKPLRDAVSANEAAGEVAVETGARSSGDQDIISPGGRAIAAALGYDIEDANAIALVFAEHVGGNGKVPIGVVRRNPVTASLTVGMFMGYMHRIREEQESASEPAEAIRRQVIGYLKGKASMLRDEEPNAPTSDARSDLNKEATALELAAEALAKEAVA